MLPPRPGLASHPEVLPHEVLDVNHIHLGGGRAAARPGAGRPGGVLRAGVPVGHKDMAAAGGVYPAMRDRPARKHKFGSSQASPAAGQNNSQGLACSFQTHTRQPPIPDLHHQLLCTAMPCLPSHRLRQEAADDAGMKASSTTPAANGTLVISNKKPRHSCLMLSTVMASGSETLFQQSPWSKLNSTVSVGPSLL